MRAPRPATERDELRWPESWNILMPARTRGGEPLLGMQLAGARVDLSDPSWMMSRFVPETA
jgi:hypothetical protein